MARGRAAGAYRGSAVDRQDGFIHFSTAEQAAETAAKWFAGQRDLVLVAVDADALGDKLKWEPSRGGALFPHLYGELPLKAVLRVDAAAARRDRPARFPGAALPFVPPFSVLSEGGLAHLCNRTRESHLDTTQR